MVRDGSLLERTFGGRQPEYYRGGEGTGRLGGRTGADATADDDDGHDVPGQLNFYKLGFEGTRRWRALKLWMSWKHVGTRGFGRLVEANIDLAALLARRCAESDDFEALPPEPELSVVCFRHLPGGRVEAGRRSPAELDAHQDRLQAALEADGDGWLSTTSLRGATWLRAGIVNTHTTPADIDRCSRRFAAWRRGPTPGPRRRPARRSAPAPPRGTPFDRRARRAAMSCSASYGFSSVASPAAPLQLEAGHRGDEEVAPAELEQHLRRCRPRRCARSGRAAASPRR